MSEQFKVGEIVIGQNFIHRTVRNGMECEILSPLELVTSRDTTTGEVSTAPRYWVRWADGDETAQGPAQLRRRKPPTTFTGEQRVAQLIRETLDRAPQRVGEPA